MPDIINVRLPDGRTPAMFANGTVTGNGTQLVNEIPTIEGPPGPRGIGVKNATINEYDHLILFLTDNSSVDAGLLPDGPPGPQGNTGVGVSTLSTDTGFLYVTLTDGTVINAGLLPQGAAGVKGDTGNYVVSANIVNNVLYLTMSDGTVINAGVVPPGQKGDKGDDGQDGRDGIDGINGTNGAAGVSVTGASINGSNQLILTLSSGATINAGVLPTGPAGQAGANGVGIANATVNGSTGELKFGLTNGVTISAGTVPTAAAGPAGVGIASATVSGGNLLLNLTNSTQINAGYVIGPQGPTGIGIANSTVNSSTGELRFGLSNGTTIIAGTVPAGPAGPAGATYENVVVKSGATGTVSCDISSNNFFDVRMTGNITMAFTGVTSSTRTYSAVIAIKQSSAGSNTVTWGTNVITPNNVNYSQSTTASAVDLYTILTYDGGVTYLLTQIGKGYL